MSVSRKFQECFNYASRLFRGILLKAYCLSLKNVPHMFHGCFKNVYGSYEVNKFRLKCYTGLKVVETYSFLSGIIKRKPYRWIIKSILELSVLCVSRTYSLVMLGWWLRWNRKCSKEIQWLGGAVRLVTHSVILLSFIMYRLV